MYHCTWSGTWHGWNDTRTPRTLHSPSAQTGLLTENPNKAQQAGHWKHIFQCRHFFKCINTYISKLLDKSSSTLLTFGLKIKKWRKQFHRIFKKELVFFVKKTTNFCTATIFDSHLTEQTKEQWQAHHSARVAAHRERDARSKQGSARSAPGLSVGSLQTAAVLEGEAGEQIPRHHLTLK